MRGIDPNLALVMIFVLACLGFIALPACTPTATVQHEVPQLDTAVSAIKKIVIAGCEKPTLDLPPVPEDVVLDIKGDKITANAGGELLLRGYVACRSLGAHSTTKR